MTTLTCPRCKGPASESHPWSACVAYLGSVVEDQGGRIAALEGNSPKKLESSRKLAEGWVRLEVPGVNGKKRGGGDKGEWICTRCADALAIYDNSGEGDAACESHAAEMGVFEPAPAESPVVEYVDTICPDCRRSCATRQTRSGPQTGSGGVLCWKNIIDLDWAREDCQRAATKEPAESPGDGDCPVSGRMECSVCGGVVAQQYDHAGSLRGHDVGCVGAFLEYSQSRPGSLWTTPVVAAPSPGLAADPSVTADEIRAAVSKEATRVAAFSGKSAPPVAAPGVCEPAPLPTAVPLAVDHPFRASHKLAHYCQDCDMHRNCHRTQPEPQPAAAPSPVTSEEAAGLVRRVEASPMKEGTRAHVGVKLHRYIRERSEAEAALQAEVAEAKETIECLDTRNKDLLAEMATHATEREKYIRERVDIGNKYDLHMARCSLKAPAGTGNRVECDYHVDCSIAAPGARHCDQRTVAPVLPPEVQEWRALDEAGRDAILRDLDSGHRVGRRYARRVLEALARETP